MAEKPQGIEGDIHGKPLSSDVKRKIEDVLKTTLEQELAKEHPTVGAAAARRPTHGSVTHGSVTKTALQ
jgi:translation initiation factor 6 (eIF-6)